MKNKYSEIRLVKSLTDVEQLAERKSLIMVQGWRKPVSAAFIGKMPYDTIERYIIKKKMYLVAKEPIAGIKLVTPLVRERNSSTGKVTTIGTVKKGQIIDNVIVNSKGEFEVVTKPKPSRWERFNNWLKSFKS